MHSGLGTLLAHLTLLLSLHVHRLQPITALLHFVSVCMHACVDLRVHTHVAHTPVLSPLQRVPGVSCLQSPGPLMGVDIVCWYQSLLAHTASALRDSASKVTHRTQQLALLGETRAPGDERHLLELSPACITCDSFTVHDCTKGPRYAR